MSLLQSILAVPAQNLIGADGRTDTTKLIWMQTVIHVGTESRLRLPMENCTSTNNRF
jgi:hypothetical protein